MLRALIVLLAAATLGAVAWLVIGRATPHEPSRAGAEAPTVKIEIAPPAPAPSASARGRGRLLGVDEAMKELDLIRPARTKVAENFTVPLLGGHTFRLSEQRGKVVFVNFWATWCPPCREEMPSMERLWREHRKRDFVLLGISLDSNAALVPPYLAEHKLTFPVALDPNLDAANAYGVRALPATFLIDRQGNVAALALGPRAWDNNAAHSLIEGLAAR